MFQCEDKALLTVLQEALVKLLHECFGTESQAEDLPAATAAAGYMAAATVLSSRLIPMQRSL